MEIRCQFVFSGKNDELTPDFFVQFDRVSNFYLSVVDDLLRHPDDKPSIGLILCKAGNQVVAEYALRDIAKPVGVSNYVTKLTETLPSHLQSSLPTVADLEAELRAVKNAGETKEPPERPRRRSS